MQDWIIKQFSGHNWCCALGCYYTSIMHGLSSCFHRSLLITTLVLETNPSCATLLAITATNHRSEYYCA
ncbi:MAG: hypothetical protein QGG88_09790 [Gammaproteobacteria bacterium]|nr:hypothetical protein [Gammaproteobacteria bacterium]